MVYKICTLINCYKQKTLICPFLFAVTILFLTPTLFLGCLSSIINIHWFVSFYFLVHPRSAQGTFEISTWCSAQSYCCASQVTRLPEPFSHTHPYWELEERMQIQAYQAHDLALYLLSLSLACLLLNFLLLFSAKHIAII